MDQNVSPTLVVDPPVVGSGGPEPGLAVAHHIAELHLVLAKGLAGVLEPVPQPVRVDKQSVFHIRQLGVTLHDPPDPAPTAISPHKPPRVQKKRGEQPRFPGLQNSRLAARIRADSNL